MQFWPVITKRHSTTQGFKYRTTIMFQDTILTKSTTSTAILILYGRTVRPKEIFPRSYHLAGTSWTLVSSVLLASKTMNSSSVEGKMNCASFSKRSDTTFRKRYAEYLGTQLQQTWILWKYIGYFWINSAGLTKWKRVKKMYLHMEAGNESMVLLYCHIVHIFAKIFLVHDHAPKPLSSPIGLWAAVGWSGEKACWLRRGRRVQHCFLSACCERLSTREGCWSLPKCCLNSSFLYSHEIFYYSIECHSLYSN